MSLSSDDLLKQSLATFRDNIDSLNFRDLEDIKDLLISSRPLYIYGTGLSCTPARYLQNALTNLDRSCILIEFTDLLESVTYNIKDDAILLLSQPTVMPFVICRFLKMPNNMVLQ